MLELYKAINSPLLVIGVITLSIPMLILLAVYLRAKRYTGEVHRAPHSAQEPALMMPSSARRIEEQVCQIEFGQVVWRSGASSRAGARIDQ